MNNLQSAAPAAPAASVKTAAASDAAAGSAALPWSDVLQAALAQHEKGLETSGSPLSVADSDATVDEGRSTAAADTTPALEPSGMVLPLLTALLPSPAGLPSLKSVPPTGDAGAAPDNDGSSAQLAATNSEPIALPGLLSMPANVTMRSTETMRAPRTIQEPLQPLTADGAGNAQITPAMADHAADIPAHGRNSGAANAPVSVQFAPATPPLTQAATPQAPQLHINAAVNSAAWSAELGQKIVLLIGEKQHVAELHLNPPDLGPLDIKLTVNEHQTTAVFTSPHSAVRDAVESALPRLREVLADSGIMLGNASVTSDSARDGAAFASSGKQHRHGDPYPGTQDAVPDGQLTTGSVLLRRGLVDLFA
jgi:flagellar hook-length control protein FliK